MECLKKKIGVIWINNYNTTTNTTTTPTGTPIVAAAVFT